MHFLTGLSMKTAKFVYLQQLLDDVNQYINEMGDMRNLFASTAAQAAQAARAAAGKSQRKCPVVDSGLALY